MTIGARRPKVSPESDLFLKFGLPEAAARAKHQGFGTPEKMVLLGNGPPNPDFGESRDPNGLYGVLEVFGCARFPPNPSRPQFLGDFLVLGDFGQGPWAPPIGPLWAYLPFVGLFALCGPICPSSNTAYANV